MQCRVQGAKCLRHKLQGAIKQISLNRYRGSVASWPGLLVSTHSCPGVHVHVLKRPSHAVGWL